MYREGRWGSEQEMEKILANVCARRLLGLEDKLVYSFKLPEDVIHSVVYESFEENSILEKESGRLWRGLVP